MNTVRWGPCWVIPFTNHVKTCDWIYPLSNLINISHYLWHIIKIQTIRIMKIDIEWIWNWFFWCVTITNSYIRIRIIPRNFQISTSQIQYDLFDFVIDYSQNPTTDRWELSCRSVVCDIWSISCWLHRVRVKLQYFTIFYIEVCITPGTDFDKFLELNPLKSLELFP